MLVVIAIIGILMTAIAPKVVGIIENAEKEADKLMAETIKNAIISAYIEDEDIDKTLECFASEVIDGDFSNINSYLQGDWSDDGINTSVENYVKDYFDL